MPRREKTNLGVGGVADALRLMRNAADAKARSNKRSTPNRLAQMSECAGRVGGEL